MYPPRQFPGFAVSQANFAASARVDKHCHDQPQFVLSLAGDYRETTQRGDHVISPMTAICLPAWCAHENTVGPKGAIDLTVNFSGEGAFDLAAMPYAVALSGGFVDELCGLSAEFWSNDPASDLAIEERVARARGALSSRAENATRARRWMPRVIERLRTNGLPVPSLSELAAEARIHRVTLCREFKRIQGETLTAFTRNWRAHCAWRALTNRGAPIADIASDCGFADQAHMTRVFRRRFGMTPGEVRRRLRDA